YSVCFAHDLLGSLVNIGSLAADERIVAPHPRQLLAFPPLVLLLALVPFLNQLGDPLPRHENVVSEVLEREPGIGSGPRGLVERCSHGFNDREEHLRGGAAFWWPELGEVLRGCPEALRLVLAELTHESPGASLLPDLAAILPLHHCPDGVHVVRRPVGALRQRMGTVDGSDERPRIR